MYEYAKVNMFLDHDRTPCVQLESTDQFKAMSPLEKVTMLHSSVQLCVAAVQAILDDHPDERGIMIERIQAMSIEPGMRRPN